MLHLNRISSQEYKNLTKLHNKKLIPQHKNHIVRIRMSTNRSPCLYFNARGLSKFSDRTIKIFFVKLFISKKLSCTYCLDLVEQNITIHTTISYDTYYQNQFSLISLLFRCGKNTWNDFLQCIGKKISCLRNGIVSKFIIAVQLL